MDHDFYYHPSSSSHRFFHYFHFLVVGFDAVIVTEDDTDNKELCMDKDEVGNGRYSTVGSDASNHVDHIHDSTEEMD